MSLDLLIVKTSSLGDVVHALPVLTDLARHRPDWTVAWVVEENFAAIPKLHPFCQKVIPVAMRRWRTSFPSMSTCREWTAFKAELRLANPRAVLDLQGLLKSAWISFLSPGQHLGYRWGSARENLATLFYSKTKAVPWALHAVERNRLLAAHHFGYALDTPVNYGISEARQTSNKTAIFIHGSSQASKLWPENHWRTLGQTLVQQGWQVTVLSGSQEEFARAKRISDGVSGMNALVPQVLEAVIAEMAKAGLAVGVDTGLTHLATALGLPTVALYTATDPKATGVFGSPVAINLGNVGEVPSVSQVEMTLAHLLGGE